MYRIVGSWKWKVLSIRDVMENRKRTVRNSEGTVQKPCQKINYMNCFLDGYNAKTMPEMRGCELETRDAALK